MAFTKTLQSVANFCSTQADLLPLSGIGGFSNEPFLTIANDALSDLITVENDWKINRAEMPAFVTANSKQDYLFAGACAFSTGGTAQGWAIDLASNSAVTVTGGVVTVNTLETHRFQIGDTIYLIGLIATIGTVSAYTSIFTDNGSTTAWTKGWVITGVTGTSFTFAATTGQNNSDVLGAPGIMDYFALTSGSMRQLINTASPQFTQELTAYRELPVTSFVANPEKVAVMSDNGKGVLKIRLYRCPGSTAWMPALVYQKQAPVKTSLGDNWSPFPDHYSAVVLQAVIYRMYRFLNSPQANTEYLKLQDAIKKAQSADDTEETSVSLKPEVPLLEGGTGDWWGW